MTPEQIQRLRELEAKATKGSLSVESDYTPIESNDPSSPFGYWEVTIWRPGEEDFVLAGQAVDTNPASDVELMVEARNALPELLDDWERMRKHLKTLLWAVDHTRCCEGRHVIEDPGAAIQTHVWQHDKDCPFEEAVRYVESIS